MTHRHTYFIGLIVGIAGLAGCDSSNDKARVNVEKGIVYEAQIVRDKTLRLEPFSADGKHLDKLGKLSFQQGSKLFAAAIQALETKGSKPGPGPIDPPTGPVGPRPGPGPDPIDPPGILILKDPLGILSGKEPLPWKLLNPAAAAGCKCKLVCTYLEDGRIDCITVCTGTDC